MVDFPLMPDDLRQCYAEGDFYTLAFVKISIKIRKGLGRRPAASASTSAAYYDVANGNVTLLD